MKKFLSIILSLAMLLALAACGNVSEETAEEAPAPEAEQEETIDPLEAARTTDQLLYQAVLDAEGCMNTMYEKIKALQSGGTPEDVIAHCNDAVLICSDARRLMQTIPEKEHSKEYVKQAESYIMNVEAANISARDVFQNSNMEASERMNRCLQEHLALTQVMVSARIDYLYAVGLPEEEIQSILGVEPEAEG